MYDEIMVPKAEKHIISINFMCLLVVLKMVYKTSFIQQTKQ